MPGPNHKEPDEGGAILAPPDFASLDSGTSDAFLPVAMSMEALLEADDETGPSAAARAAAAFAASEDIPERSVEEQPSSVPTSALLEEPVTAFEAEEFEPEKKPIGAILAVLGLAIVAGILWFTLGDDSEPEAAGVDVAVASTERPDEERRARNEGPAPEVPVPSAARLPTELEALKALSYDERHKLLSTAQEDVVVEDHLALDLVQASQSPTPCKTFSGALSTIESSEDRARFQWAIDEAAVPLDQNDGDACEGLEDRLSALRSPSNPPPPRRRRRRSAGRAKPGPSLERKPEPPEAEPPSQPDEQPPPKPDAAAKQEPKPDAAKASVASKLEDGGGLRELD